MADASLSALPGASDARFRALIEKSFDVVLLTDADGIVHYCSPSVSRVLGNPPEHYLNRFLGYQLMHPDDVPAVKEAFARLRRTPGISVFATYRCIHKDGSWRWLETCTSNLLDDPEVGAIVTNYRDITDQKEAQDSLQRSEQRLRAVLENLPVGVWVTDPAGTVILANPASHQIWGAAASEAKGWWADSGDPVKPEEWPLARAIVQAGIVSGQAIAIERDGKRRTILQSAAPIRDEIQQPVGAVVVTEDITEQRKLEEQFRQAQKMEAIGRLAGGVAHDFNNLLTIISGYSEMLAGLLPDTDPRLQLVQEIQQAGSRAAGLTSQLLAFSRQTVLAPKVLNINTLLRDMEKLLRRLLGEDVILDTSFDPALGRAKVDGGQLEQAVMNLAVNARDAMPDGGKLTIETQNVALDEAYAAAHPDVRPGHYIMLAVSDTGAGMDASTQARIFEPFFTTKEIGKGTGLGLAMVYGFVKQSGGHVAVHSEPRRGATFKVYLPRIDEPLTPQTADTGPAAMPKGTETLLLVEDEACVRTLATYVLRSCGYEVLQAGRGAEAIRIAEQHRGRLHLLITDVVMPEMSGVELVATLLQRFGDLRVMYLSGYTQDAILRRGVSQEQVHFLQKPFTPAALASKVREILDAER